MHRFAAFCLCAVLATTPAMAKPNAQLVQSVENRLSIWGLGDVDGDGLTTAQIAALHLKLTNAPPRYGRNAIRFKQELKSILRWKPRRSENAGG